MGRNNDSQSWAKAAPVLYQVNKKKSLLFFPSSPCLLHKHQVYLRVMKYEITNAHQYIHVQKLEVGVGDADDQKTVWKQTMPRNSATMHAQPRIHPPCKATTQSPTISYRIQTKWLKMKDHLRFFWQISQLKGKGISQVQSLHPPLAACLDWTSRRCRSRLQDKTRNLEVRGGLKGWTTGMNELYWMRLGGM